MQRGVFARIQTPELILPDDIVYFRHSTKRSTKSKSNTRQGNLALMRVINGDVGNLPGDGDVWFKMYPPISDLSGLSVKVGKAYKWVKVGEYPNYHAPGKPAPFQNKPDLVKVAGEKHYWAGNLRCKSRVGPAAAPGQPVESLIWHDGRYYNFTVIDMTVVRNGTEIAWSQQYLLKSWVTLKPPNIYLFGVTAREI